MIRLTVKGLAEFMTSTPAKQRKTLRDFKYPDEDEPFARRLYYREAREHISAFHRRGRDRDWLREKADDVAELARLNGGQSEIRLRNNSRGIRAYERHFGARRFEVLDEVRMELRFADVRISVVPDLHVIEGKKEKIIKLDFGVKAPSPDIIRIVSQVMLEAARGVVGDLTSSSALYLDIGRGAEHRGARAGARTLRDIEAACETISAVWEGL